MQSKISFKNRGKVMMYSKSYCSYCTEAKKILSAGNVPYSVMELD